MGGGLAAASLLGRRCFSQAFRDCWVCAGACACDRWRCGLVGLSPCALRFTETIAAYHRVSDATYLKQGQFMCVDLYVRHSSDRIGFTDLWQWYVLLDVCDPWCWRDASWVWPYHYPRDLERAWRTYLRPRYESEQSRL